MKMRLGKGILSITIILGMLFQGIPVCVMADEPQSVIAQATEENELQDLAAEVINANANGDSVDADTGDASVLPVVEYELTEEELELKNDLVNDAASLFNAVEGEDYVSDELIASCDSLEDAQAIADAYTEYTGTTVTVDNFEYGVAVLKIEDTADTSVQELVRLSSHMDNNLPPVSANVCNELCIAETDNETFTDPFTKADSNCYQYYHEMIGSKYVWEALDDGSARTAAGEDLAQALSQEVVAVVDTGVNPNHDDFYITNSEGEKESILVGGKSFVAGIDPNDPSDGHGHGTHVAGIIAASANDVGGRGIASGVKVMPLRVFNASGSGGTSEVIARAVKYAAASRMKYNGTDPGPGYEDVPAANVTVINMSLGSAYYNTVYDSAVRMASDVGIVICAASGNYGFTGYYYPAAYDQVISVSAINKDYQRSKFSDYGTWVDICAPGGENTLDCKYASNSYSRVESVYSTGHTGTSSVVGKRGTSQATPMVAAAAAVVIAKYGEVSPATVENILEETSTKVTNPYLGAGCVNVAAAVDFLQDVPEAVPLIPDGSTVAEGTKIRLSSANPAAFIYYTINGKTPDLNDLSGTGTVIYDDEDPSTYPVIINDGKKSVKLQVVSTLYGKQGQTAAYTYYCDKKAVKNIDIDSATGDSRVTVGKKLTLRANVYPQDADNKKIIWSSSDSSVATVSTGGVVSANAVGHTTITAKADDGYGAEAYFDVYILPGAEKIEILPPDALVKMSDADTILLNAGEVEYDLESGIFTDDTYDMSMESGLIKVWPEDALQKVSYKSSNPAVAFVSEDGVVTALSPGNATITVTAADGTNVYDTQKFKVVCSVYAIDIRDSNNTLSKDVLLAGNTLTPKVTFNNGLTVPGNKKLSWRLKDSSDGRFVSVDASTGKIKARSNDYVESKAITVVAVSQETGVSGEYTFNLYKKQTSIAFNDTSLFTYNGNGSYNTKIGDTIYLYTILETANYADYARMFSVTSSNENVVAVHNNNMDYKGSPKTLMRAINSGTATLTFKTLDGSNLTRSIKINVLNLQKPSSAKLSIDCVSGSAVYYPGKRLKFAAHANQEMELRNVQWLLVDAADGEDKYVYPYLTVNNGVVTRNTQTGMIPDTHMKALLYCGGTDPYNNNVQGCTAIDLYPAAVSSVKVYDESGNALTTVKFDRVGQSRMIYPKSLPENSCQDGYSFSSSNAKVVKVYSDGRIEAVKNGTAIVYITAGDGSGKKTSIRVTVAQDKTQSISLSANEMKLSLVPTMSTPSAEILTVAGVLPVTAGKNFIVTSGNNKVATVVSAGMDSETGLPKYYVKAVGKGATYITVKADDGSSKYSQCKVTVGNIVTDIKIKSLSGSYILKPSKALTLKATVNSDASNKNVRWYFTDPSSMEQYAALDAATGRVVAKDESVTGQSEHVVQVYSKAVDEGGTESGIVSITVSPSKVLVKNLSVKNSSDCYDLSYGYSMQMKAATTSDASNKKVTWSVYDTVSGESSGICTITQSGYLRVVSAPTEKTVVTVRASAQDGSGVYGEKNITVYPKAKNIIIDSDADVRGSGVHDIQAGQELVLTVESVDVNGLNESCNKYLITYSTGYGKAYLNSSDGTSVTVRAVKPGKMYVYAQLKDGSAKKVSYIVNIH